MRVSYRQDLQPPLLLVLLSTVLATNLSWVRLESLLVDFRVSTKETYL